MSKASVHEDSEYPFEVGDTVRHRNCLALTGVVTHIDKNLPHPTTCLVRWENNSGNLPRDDNSDDDIQWTNRLIKVM